MENKVHNKLTVKQKIKLKWFIEMKSVVTGKRKFRMEFNHLMGHKPSPFVSFFNNFGGGKSNVCGLRKT